MQLERRIAQLERRNRRLTYLSTIIVVVVGVSLIMGAAAPSPSDKGGSLSGIRTIQIVDRNGAQAAVIDANGVRYERAAQLAVDSVMCKTVEASADAGVIVRDTTKYVRIGFDGRQACLVMANAGKPGEPNVTKFCFLDTGGVTRDDFARADSAIQATIPVAPHKR